MSSGLQKKGALLIITNNAAEEARRLSSQCINLKPIKLTPESLYNLSSIDGGILIDLDGTVHVGGVILDGIVGTKGDSARGSRYNSAITYYEYHKGKLAVIIVVISEDGMINVIPKLLPKIKHSEITHIINILAQLSLEENFDRKVFYEVMEWLKKRKFYLTKSECETINELKIALQTLDPKLNGHAMWIEHENFYPNPDMNDAYYIF